MINNLYKKVDKKQNVASITPIEPKDLIKDHKYSKQVGKRDQWDEHWATKGVLPDILADGINWGGNKIFQYQNKYETYEMHISSANYVEDGELSCGVC